MIEAVQSPAGNQQGQEQLEEQSTQPDADERELEVTVEPEKDAFFR